MVDCHYLLSLGIQDACFDVTKSSRWGFLGFIHSSAHPRPLEEVGIRPVLSSYTDRHSNRRCKNPVHYRQSTNRGVYTQAPFHLWNAIEKMGRASS